jgi:hypothetical protein
MSLVRYENGRPALGGASDRSSVRANTPRDLPPLPAHSLRPDPFDDDIRSRSAGAFVTVFLSLWFLVPMICVGVILKFQ